MKVLRKRFNECVKPPRKVKVSEAVEGQELDAFADELWDEVSGRNGGGRFDEDTTEALIKNSNLHGDWESYDSAGFGLSFALNVKGKGWGNWTRFNQDNRATDAGFTRENYAEALGDYVQLFHNRWNTNFKEKFGIELFTMGRSAGHWGFNLGDMINGVGIFGVNDAAVSELYDKLAKDETIREDFAVVAANDIIKSGADVAKYFKFTDEFVKMCEEFSLDVAKTSTLWASDEFNDEEFVNLVAGGVNEASLVSEADEDGKENDDDEDGDEENGDDEDDNGGVEVEVGVDKVYAKKLINFGCKLLMFGVESHIWHLNCKSNAEHLTLKELYEGCDDLGDKLLEATLGTVESDIENKEGNPEYKFGNLVYGKNCIEQIREIENEASELIDECDDGGIENILADFCELCNSVVYKLKRLK